jgi:hypothetical protein
MTGASADIEARDLTKTYPKDVRALDGLGFCTWLATRAFRSHQRAV